MNQCAYCGGDLVERLTTFVYEDAAERAGHIRSKLTEMIDALAAAPILQELH